MFSRIGPSYPSKIPVHKSDGAPMLVFIDIIKSDQFENPCLGSPLRIDKITNGLPTLFFYPSRPIFQKYNDLYYTLNFEKIYPLFIRNLIHYSKLKYSQICGRQLSNSTIIKWLEQSLNLDSMLLSYQKDLEDIFTSLLASYCLYLDQGDEKKAFFYYCQKIIDLCNTRIKNNQVEFIFNKKPMEQALYKIKKGKYYPEIIEFDVQMNTQNKLIKQCCIPLFIYDDLMECFLFNQQQLNESNLTIYHYEDMINKNLIEVQSQIPSKIEISKIKNKIRLIK
jgi:hypothetical protein